MFCSFWRSFDWLLLPHIRMILVLVLVLGSQLFLVIVLAIVQVLALVQILVLVLVMILAMFLVLVLVLFQILVLVLVLVPVVPGEAPGVSLRTHCKVTPENGSSRCVCVCEGRSRSSLRPNPSQPHTHPPTVPVDYSSPHFLSPPVHVEPVVELGPRCQESVSAPLRPPPVPNRTRSSVPP